MRDIFNRLVLVQLGDHSSVGVLNQEKLRARPWPGIHLEVEGKTGWGIDQFRPMRGLRFAKIHYSLIRNGSLRYTMV